MEISDRLRAARLAIGMTQEQVAAGAGMNVTQYNGYERGRSRPAAATLERLAIALQTSTPVLEGEGRPALGGGDLKRSSVERRIDTLRSAFCSDVAKLLGLSPGRVHLQIEIV